MLMSNVLALQGTSSLPSLFDNTLIISLIDAIIVQAQKDDCLSGIPEAVFRCREDLMHGIEPSPEDLVALIPLLFNALLVEMAKKSVYDREMEKIDQILDAVTSSSSRAITDTQDQRPMISKRMLFQDIDELIDLIVATRVGLQKELEDKAQQVIAGLIRSQKNLQRSIDALTDGIARIENKLLASMTDAKHELHRINSDLHEIFKVLKGLAEGREYISVSSADVPVSGT